ncbi:MAG: hypothetical protein KAJ95_01125 [Gammaproteobacteria bacterium]|nr:hypothetical protein [Gammaproteobacteria bacterium]
MKPLTFFLLIVLSSTLQADQLFDDTAQSDHVERKRESSEPKPLGIDGLPEYPDDTNLRQLNIRQSSQIFYVDISSISSSKKENTVRLVTVAISPHGARTVAYEGLDCGYRRYQPFAFAGSEGPLKPFADQGWRPVIDESNGRYRRVLIDSYLCRGFAYAASREKILSRMRNLKPYSNKTRRD